MAFRVKDATAAHERAIGLGATNVEVKKGTGELDIPAIEGIGGSRLFFVDRYGESGSIYDVDFDFHPDWQQRTANADSRLTYIDHLTHNVNRGRMSVWADFYERLFNFREIRYFDIEGTQTGLFSKAMTSPCGKIRIPLNESQDDKSQIEEFLREYKGEGIQHIALGTSNIYEAVDIIRARGIEFQDTPETYYELLPVHLVKIHGRRGVKIRGLWYDGPALDPYRSGLSPQGGAARGKWKIRREPRDRKCKSPPVGGEGAGGACAGGSSAERAGA